MAHSLPPTIANRGDWTRARVAHQALIACVLTDRRVQTCASRWRAGQASQLRATLESMGLARLPWFTRLGSHVEHAWHLALQSKPGEQIVYPATTAPDDYATGKAPTRGGEDIQRNTRWWYRHYCCGESLKALGREYARQAGRRTEATSVVRNGIQQIDALLNVPDPTDTEK